MCVFPTHLDCESVGGRDGELVLLFFMFLMGEGHDLSIESFWYTFAE